MNCIKCESCKFGIPVDANERVLLCDNPDLKSYGKNVKHGRRFSCGYGVGDGLVTIKKTTAIPPTFSEGALKILARPPMPKIIIPFALWQDHTGEG